jgi:hypothetical protein
MTNVSARKSSPPVHSLYCDPSRSPLQVPSQPSDRRRVDNLIEQRRAPDQQRETEHLQPLERLPAQAQRDEPDEQRAARVDCAAGCCGDLARDGEAEEVEAAVQ